MSTLQNNIASLEALIEKANNLPAAGGGGGAVETCTVTITRRAISDPYLYKGIVYYLGLDSDGNTMLTSLTLPVGITDTQTVTLSCIKNTLVHLAIRCTMESCSGATYERAYYYNVSGTENNCGYNIFVTDEDATIKVRQ